MKNLVVKLTTIIMIVSVLLCPMGVVHASGTAGNQVNINDCSKDPYAPCYSEKFSNKKVVSVISDKALLTQPLSTLRIQCGVNVYDSLNHTVASLTQTDYVTWGSGGSPTISSTSTATWVKNSFYYWQNVDWYPNTNGSYGVTSGGDIWYVTQNWGHYQVTTSFLQGAGNFTCN